MGFTSPSRTVTLLLLFLKEEVDGSAVHLIYFGLCWKICKWMTLSPVDAIQYAFILFL